MNIPKFLQNASFMLVFFSLSAQCAPFQLPNELTTKYGVIAPLCFERFINLNENQKKSLNLTSDPCLSYSKPYNEYALKKGFIGYNIDSDEGGMKLPYLFYRYIGAMNKQGHKNYLFLIEWSGGGTGSFSQLVTMRLNQNRLTLHETIASGDRCNGGVKTASVQNNQLQFQVNMTPYALYDLKKSENNLKDINLIYDCAVCCIGTIHYQGQQVVGVKFNGESQTVQPAEKKQSCFNRLIKQYGADKKAYLDKQKLTDLLNDLHRTC